jgi:hypothetical protein
MDCRHYGTHVVFAAACKTLQAEYVLVAAVKVLSVLYCAICWSFDEQVISK